MSLLGVGAAAHAIPAAAKTKVGTLIAALQNYDRYATTSTGEAGSGVAA